MTARIDYRVENATHNGHSMIFWFKLTTADGRKFTKDIRELADFGGIDDLDDWSRIVSCRSRPCMIPPMVWELVKFDEYGNQTRESLTSEKPTARFSDSFADMCDSCRAKVMTELLTYVSDYEPDGVVNWIETE